jgi:hypothetical protein
MVERAKPTQILGIRDGQEVIDFLVLGLGGVNVGFVA